MPSRSNILLILPMLVFAVACRPQAEQEAESALPEYTMRSLERTEGECEEYGRNCFRLMISWPEFTGGPAALREAANAAVSDFLNEDLRGYLAEGQQIATGNMERLEALGVLADSLAASYLRLREEMPEAASVRTWFNIIEIEPVWVSETYTTLRMATDAYTGGAHGIYLENWLTLRNTDGAEMGYNDLFGDLAAFTDRAEVEFRSVRDIPAGSPLAEAGFFITEEDEEGIFRLPENFGLTADSLILYYNPYEISAYAAGPTRLAFAKEELAPMMK